MSHGTKIQHLLLALGLLPLAAPAYAWGSRGHELIARLAELQVSPATKAAVTELLTHDQDDPPQIVCGESGFGLKGAANTEKKVPFDATGMQRVANYPDQIRKSPIGDGTAHWHFTNIQHGETEAGFTAQRYCAATTTTHFRFDAAKGCYVRLAANKQTSTKVLDDCSFAKVPEFAKTLGDNTKSVAERVTALKFLIHMTGDLHQPLHNAEWNFDAGGNARGISFPGESGSANLHEAWDTLILDRAIRLSLAQATGLSAADADNLDITRSSQEQFARELNSRIEQAKTVRWFQDNSGPKDWAFGAYQLAMRFAYTSAFKQNFSAYNNFNVTELDQAYYEQARAPALNQIMRAGQHLATLLDQAFAH